MSFHKVAFAFRHNRFIRWVKVNSLTNGPIIGEKDLYRAEYIKDITANKIIKSQFLAGEFDLSTFRDETDGT